MGSLAEQGLGASIYIAGYEIAEMTDLGDYGPTNADLDVTSHDSSSNADEFMAGMVSGGEVTTTHSFKATDTNGQLAAIGYCEAGTICPYVITLPNTLASTFAFTGYVKSYKIKSGLKDTIKITFVHKITRVPVWTV